MVILLFTASYSMAQVLEYEIVKGGKAIGQMTVVKKQIGDSTLYSIESVTNYRVLVTLRVEYDVYEYYYKGVYQSGKSHSTLNGATQSDIKVRKNNNNYEITRVSDILTYRGEIRYSIPEIYFSEPVGRTSIFSQAFGVDLEISPLGNHRYQISSEDGKNIYSFKNGICSEVRVNRSYAVFYIRLKS